MKLFTKYNRINVVASILIFFIGCLAFYIVLNYVLIRQLDKTLRSEKSEILQHVKEHNELPEILNTNEQRIEFSPTKVLNTKVKYFSIKIWDTREKEKEWKRTLVFPVEVSGKNYIAIVTKSQVETEELLSLIIGLAVGMIALIIAANYFINKIVLRKLWQPFYVTINRIGNYQLSKQQTSPLPVTAIDEFNLLNDNFNNMTKKIEHEYETLKEFTGNAAHEMQTPLAVIANNAEALMQDEFVLKNHHQTIAIIEQSVNRLSRLNQSLLLLTKIENQRFALNETVQWDELVQQKVDELQELITSQGMQILLDLKPVATQFNHHLADIVINNLINNAIRYNLVNGSITISLKNNQFIIANMSDLPALDAKKIGTRFYRHPATKLDGNGLGLSIVKQICTVGGYEVAYYFKEERHYLSINF